MTPEQLALIAMRAMHDRACERVPIHAFSPGAVGGRPTVDVKSASIGFDWDRGQLILTPEQPVALLTAEQVEAVVQSVRAGQSWHAYQQYKRQCDEIAALTAGIAELERHVPAGS